MTVTPADLPLTDSLDGLTATTPDTDMSELVCATGCFGRRCAPHCLQRFATARCYVVALLALSLLLGAARGYLTGLASVIGFNYGLPDAFVDWVLVAGELAQGLVALFVAHGGSREHRPSWLAAPVLLHAGACFVVFVPLVFHGSGSHASIPPPTDAGKFLCPAGGRAGSALDVEPCWTALAALVFLQVTAGFSTAALYTHGVAYLDDNVDATDSPTLLGLFVGTDRLGPLVGRILAFWCAHLSGARAGQLVVGKQLGGPWWAGWPMLGALLLPAALLVSMFPERLPSMAVRQRANNILSAVCGRVRIDDKPTDIDAEPGLWPTFKRIVKNKVLVFTTVFLMMIYAAIYAYKLYENRYLESVYFIPEPEFSGGVFKDQWVSRVTTGFLKPPIVFMTMLLSGMIIARKRPRASSLAAWNIGVAVVVMAIFLSYIGLRCDLSLDGWVEGDMLDLTRGCNRDCNCPDNIPFVPVCDGSGLTTYYSPCHAGCSAINYIDDIKLYSNCKCISYGGKGKDGACSDSSCTAKWVFYQSLGVFVSFLLGTCIVGSILLCLRSVAPQDKTTALGFLVMHLGIIPAPIKFAYKIMTDKACKHRGDDNYECQLFDPYHLGISFNVFTASFFLKAAIVAIVAWWKSKSVKLFADDLEDDDDDGVEMTEWRHKINTRLATPYVRRRRGQSEDNISDGDSNAGDNDQNANGDVNEREDDETQPLRPRANNEIQSTPQQNGHNQPPWQESDEDGNDSSSDVDSNNNGQNSNATTPNVRQVTYV